MRGLRLILLLAASIALTSVAAAQIGLPWPGPGTPASAGGGSTVTFDAATTTPATGTASNTLSLTTFTVGSGSNRYLVAGICWQVQAASITGIAWDPSGTNQAMSQITTQNTNGAVGRCELWGLVAPTSGNKTMTVTFSQSTGNVVLGGISFTGVNQTGNASASTVTAATPIVGTGANPSIVITSGSTHLTVSCGGDGSSVTAFTQTTAWNNNGGSVGGHAGYNTTGAASVTHTYTATSAVYGFVGIDILPAP